MGELFDILRFALPDNDNLPAEFFQFADLSLVSQNILIKFLIPVIRIARRAARFSATTMLMPKAAVNEYGNFVLRKYDVRAARKVTAMQAKPITELMQK